MNPETETASKGPSRVIYNWKKTLSIVYGLNVALMPSFILSEEKGICTIGN
ncbi:rCG41676 [Rattus norvegicus]|uniref:RCG41676 n=1 Tax=Rattus norvegicus TaxID=10116 RepID=A6IHA2_RAT|nr:rCG41676 [Rattus norvegicus]